jgi:hypothetical protein
MQSIASDSGAVAPTAARMAAVPLGRANLMYRPGTHRMMAKHWASTPAVQVGDGRAAIQPRLGLQVMRFRNPLWTTVGCLSHTRNDSTAIVDTQGLMPRISGTNQDAFPLGLELPPALPVVASAGQCTMLTTGVTPDPGRGLNFMRTPFSPGILYLSIL